MQIVSLGDNCMKCQSLFSGKKNKTNIILNCFPAFWKGVFSKRKETARLGVVVVVVGVRGGGGSSSLIYSEGALEMATLIMVIRETISK